MFIGVSAERKLPLSFVTRSGTQYYSGILLKVALPYVSLLVRLGCIYSVSIQFRPQIVDYLLIAYKNLSPAVDLEHYLSDSVLPARPYKCFQKSCYL